MGGCGEEQRVGRGRGCLRAKVVVHRFGHARRRSNRWCAWSSTVDVESGCSWLRRAGGIMLLWGQAQICTARHPSRGRCVPRVCRRQEHRGQGRACSPRARSRPATVVGWQFCESKQPTKLAVRVDYYSLNYRSLRLPATHHSLGVLGRLRAAESVQVDGDVGPPRWQPGQRKGDSGNWPTVNPGLGARCGEDVPCRLPRSILAHSTPKRQQCSVSVSDDECGDHRGCVVYGGQEQWQEHRV